MQKENTGVEKDLCSSNGTGSGRHRVGTVVASDLWMTTNK